MPDSHFHDRVNNVAARDIHIYGSANQLQPGPLHWAQKRYWFGKSITSGWLTICFVLLFVISAFLEILSSLTSLFNHRSISNLQMLAPILLVSILLFAAGARQLHNHGFLHVGTALSGFAKAKDGHVFFGTLGGSGIFCPKCQAKVTLQRVGFQTRLRCTLNSAHAWLFDPTEVA